MKKIKEFLISGVIIIMCSATMIWVASEKSSRLSGYSQSNEELRALDNALGALNQFNDNFYASTLSAALSEEGIDFYETMLNDHLENLQNQKEQSSALKRLSQQIDQLSTTSRNLLSIAFDGESADFEALASKYDLYLTQSGSIQEIAQGEISANEELAASFSSKSGIANIVSIVGILLGIGMMFFFVVNPLADGMEQQQNQSHQYLSKVRQLTGDNQELLKSIDAKNQQIQQHQLKLESSKSKLQALSKDRKTLVSRQQKLKQELAVLEGRMDQKQQENKEAENRLHDNSRHIHRLEDQNESLHQSVQDLKDVLQQHQEDLSIRSSELKVLSEKIEEQKLQNLQVANNNEVLKSEASSLEQTCHLLKVQIDDKRREIEKKEKALANSDQEIKELKVSGNKLQIDAHVAREERKHIEIELDDKTSKLEKVEYELEEKNDAISSVRAQNAELVAENIQLKNEKQDIMTSLNEAKNELSVVKKDLLLSVKEREHVDAELSGAYDEINHHQNINSDLRKDIEAIEKAIAEILGKDIHAEGESGNIQDWIQELVSKNEVPSMEGFSLQNNFLAKTAEVQWGYDVRARKFELSKEWKNLFGYTNGDISENFNEFLNFVHPDDRPQLKNSFEYDIANTSSSLDLEFRVKTKTGGYQWAKSKGSIVKNQQEEPIKIQGKTLDVTHLKDTEKNLRNLALAAEHTDNMILLTDKYLRVEWVNDKLENKLGLSLSEMEGQKADEYLLSSKLDKKVVRDFHKSIDDEIAFQQELLTKTKGGESAWMLTSVVPQFEDGGLLTNYLIIQQDITQIREKEEELSKLSLVASNTDNAVIITNQHGEIEWVNKGFTDITEYTLEEVMGKKPGNFLQGTNTNPEDVKAIRRGLSSGRAFSQEIVNYSKSGREYILSLSINPIFDDNGEIAQFIAIERDVTESKRLEQEIFDSEEQLRKMMDEQFAQSEQLIAKEEQLKLALDKSEKIQEQLRNLSLVASKTDNAVIITDQYGMIEYVNDGFERITEYKLDEVIGKKPGDFLQGPNTDPQDVLEIRRKLQNREAFTQEIYNYSKTGKGYWLSLSITPVFTEKGELDKFIAIESDITDRKEKEETLQNLSLVASKTDNAVIITDHKGQIIYANEGFEKITEYRFEEVRGKKPGSFLQGPETDPEHVRAIRQGLDSRRSFQQEIVNYSKSGRKYWLNISITPILDQYGQVDKFIAIESDITEQKEAEVKLSNLSLVASKTDNAVIITDQYGGIEWVNDGFEKLTEYRLSEVKGKKPGSFLQGEKTRAEDVQVIRENLQRKQPFKHEIYNYSKSGRGYWLSLSITPIFDNHGNLEKFIAIESDITAAKKRDEEITQAETEMRHMMDAQFEQSEQLLAKEDELQKALKEALEAKTESENLSLVASKTDNAVIITDQLGAIQWVNEGFERITEYRLDEVVGKKPGSFLQGPETDPEDVRTIRQGISSKRPFKHQIYNYSKSGRGYWLSLSITPVFDDNGQLEKFIAIESDITIEKEREKEIENLSIVASKTDNAVIVTDQHGAIQWVNDSFTKITEYTLPEVKGRKPGSFLQGEKTNPEDVRKIREGLRSRRPFRHEIYNYSKSGRGYWLSLSISPVFGDGGQVEKFVAIESDITLQKESQERLENLSLVANKTDNAVIITNKFGAIEWVNEGFTRITEYELEEVKGKKPGSFLQGDKTRSEDIRAIRKGLDSLLPFQHEIYNYSKSGRGYWLSLSITPVFNERGDLEKFIAIESDVTASKKLSEEIKESEEQMRAIMEEQFSNSEKLIAQEAKLADALAQAENLSLVASKTDNAVIISDGEGLIQYVNDAFMKISGYHPDEVVGKKPGSFLQGPDTDPAHVQAIRDGLASKKPFNQEILNYSKNGKPYWLNISMTPILDSEGNVEKFIAIESDITERKSEEEQMQNLSLVASKTENAVIITDKDGYVEWVNNSFTVITEYTLEEVLGKKPGNFLQGEATTEEQVDTIREGLKSMKPFTAEIYNYSKSGRGYWLQLSISPVFDEEGALQKFIAIESDITERKQLEQEITESEEQMRHIMDDQFAASEKLLDKEKELKKALQKEKSSREELDNTLARLKETQSQVVQNEKMASLGQLTAGIAHEINNPINFVYNGIDSLKMSLDDLITIINQYDHLASASAEDIPNLISEIEATKKKLRFGRIMKNLPEVLSDIKTGANRTIEIVKGLRVFSRLDEEEQKMANINECLNSTLILLRNKTKDLIKVRKFYDNHIDDIMCFPGQLNQVFMNLLTNAIQAIPEDKKDGEIMIYTENLEKSIIIRILDNGTGIPEDVKKRIFEPFYTTKPVGIGTGLGLSISFGIIEKHDGKIYVNSEMNKGTEFVIELPKETVKLKTA